MADAFNSPAHAISFLKRRGVYKERLVSGIHIEYVELTHPVEDIDEVAACRYLISKDYPTTYRHERYRP